jgi:uncharacterized repeat protein (TIGR01451 family)
MLTRHWLRLVIVLLLCSLTIALVSIALAQTPAAPLNSIVEQSGSSEPFVTRELKGRVPSTQPVSIQSVAANGTVTITTEGFEGTFPGPGWDPIIDHWGASTCKSHTGAKSAWVEGSGGLTCGSTYHANEQSWIIYGPFNLSDAIAAQLKFSYWINSEPGFDTLFFGSAITTTYFGFVISGTSSGWVDRTFDLSSRLGQANVWVAFVWDTDSTIQNTEGAYVDDIVLTKSIPAPNLVLQKASNRATADAGDTLTYTLSVQNNGTVNAPSSRLTDTLPISMSLVGGSLVASSGSTNVSGPNIIWTGALNVGQTARLTYTVVLTNNIPDGATLVNTVVANDGTGGLYNSQASVNVGVSLTYLPTVVRNYCAAPAIGENVASLQPDMLQIDAYDAWLQCVLGDPSIVVAILDTGIDLDHPDLVANLIPGYDFAQGDSVPDDGHGHGSNVAGITGAALNGVGVVGVAPRTHLLPVKVLGDNGSGTFSAIASGVTYAADRAHILNMSLGGTADAQVLRDAIAYAVNTRGRLVVAAAGNCGDPTTYFLNGCSFVNQPNYPGAYSLSYANVMAVAAVTSGDTRASFSNVGSYVTIAAPGVNIYNTYKNGGYQSQSGTSQAAPHVAGLAALIWARNPSYTAAQVRSAIETTAIDLGTAGKDTSFGWGRISVLPAVGLSSVESEASAAQELVALPAPADRRDAEIVPGRVLIKFKPGVGIAGVEQALGRFAEVSVAGEIASIDVQILNVPAGQEWLLIDQLRVLPDVAYAEPDYIVHLPPAP